VPLEPELPDEPDVPEEPDVPLEPEVPEPIPLTDIVPPVLFSNSNVPVPLSNVAPVIAAKEPGNIFHLAVE
jgi:hypothetical protein